MKTIELCVFILMICASNLGFFLIGRELCSKIKIIEIKENQVVTVYEEQKKSKENYDDENAIEFMTNQEELDSYNRMLSRARNRIGDDE